MAAAPPPRKKKAAPDAAELREPLSAEELRRQAEERLAGLSAAAPAPEELAAAVHELRVHQIELEMQNEELRRAQLELEISRAKHVELFHLAPVGYLTLNEWGIVGDANLTAAHLLGVERRQLVGQPFSAFVVAADRKEYYRHLEVLKQTEAPQTCELRLQPVGGEPFWAHLDGQPQRAGGGSGEPSGYNLTFTDVDERVLAAEALRQREEQLERAVEGSGVGLWDWRPQTGEETFSERWAEIVGYTLAELAPTSIETWRGLCDPDDLQLSDELLEEHFAGHSDIYACEARMRHKDGHWVWVLDRGKVAEWDSDGRPLRMIGTHLDVTARKQAGDALHEASLYARNLIETSLDPLVTISAEGRVTDVNAATEKITGRSREELIGSDFADYFAEPEMARAGYLKAFSAGQIIDYPLAIRHSSGAITEVLYNASVYRNEQGDVLGVFAAARDVTAQRRAGKEIQQRNQELAHLNAELVAEAAALEAANATIMRIAATDDLTSLANRRSFYESLEKAVSLARRHGSPLALVSLDLDGLKQVNDSAGHKAGDEVLASFAELLGALCRAEDVPGRLGGDEFSVLLPGVDLSGARGLAERVLAAVRSCEVLAQRGVTVSAGVVQWSSDELPDDLLRRADEALYAAKRVGGDAAAIDG